MEKIAIPEKAKKMKFFTRHSGLLKTCFICKNKNVDFSLGGKHPPPPWILAQCGIAACLLANFCKHVSGKNTRVPTRVFNRSMICVRNIRYIYTRIFFLIECVSSFLKCTPSMWLGNLDYFQLIDF